MDTEERFEKFDHEFLKFKCVDNPPFQTPKICGLIAIEKLEGEEVEFSAEHDKVWCGSCKRDLTDEEVVYLLRCGILWDEEYESFFFFT